MRPASSLGGARFDLHEVAGSRYRGLEGPVDVESDEDCRAPQDDGALAQQAGTSHGFTAIAMIDVGGQGRCESILLQSHTNLSNIFICPDPSVVRLSIRPLTYQGGREMRLKSRIRSTRKPTCSIFPFSSSCE